MDTQTCFSLWKNRCAIVGNRYKGDTWTITCRDSVNDMAWEEDNIRWEGEPHVEYGEHMKNKETHKATTREALGNAATYEDHGGHMKCWKWCGWVHTKKALWWHTARCKGLRSDTTNYERLTHDKCRENHMWTLLAPHHTGDKCAFGLSKQVTHNYVKGVRVVEVCLYTSRIICH